jgi:hypothetical protein
MKTSHAHSDERWLRPAKRRGAARAREGAAGVPDTPARGRAARPGAR